MRDVVIHLGHCYRTRGATGTAGHRGSEQEFVSNVGIAMEAELQMRGVDAVTALADASLPRCQIFVALHQDGSNNSRARGASVGYPGGSQNYMMAQIWKAHYSLAGWPSGFRGDNYTRGLRMYYGYRRVNADVKFLIEHGFATNPTDANWMWDHIPNVVQANCNALVQYLDPLPPALGSSEGEPMIVYDDKAKIVYTVDWVSKRYRESGPKAGMKIPVYADFKYVLADFGLSRVGPAA